MVRDSVLKKNLLNSILVGPVNSTQDLRKKHQTQTSPIFNAIQMKLLNFMERKTTHITI